MKKNTTTLATLALAILDSLINSVEETPQTTETIPTTSPSNSPIMYGTSRESFGETDVVNFLVDEVGMKLKSSSTEYPSTAKMLCMSTDEVRQIMSYCDELKKKAEFGDKVLKSVQMLKGLFK